MSVTHLPCYSSRSAVYSAMRFASPSAAMLSEALALSARFISELAIYRRACARDLDLIDIRDQSASVVVVVEGGFSCSGWWNADNASQKRNICIYTVLWASSVTAMRIDIHHLSSEFECIFRFVQRDFAWVYLCVCVCRIYVGQLREHDRRVSFDRSIDRWFRLGAKIARSVLITCRYRVKLSMRITVLQ